MADYALVVGIEVYAYAPALHPLNGPALDAMRFALWLYRAQGVPAANIRLLCAPSPSPAWKEPLRKEYEELCAVLDAAGIRREATLSYREIATAFYTDLLSGPQEMGTLWIYWSGHGVTWNGENDSVMCADVQNGDPTFIYLREFRDALRSKDYRRFGKQFLIVDACSEYVRPEDLGMRRMRKPDDWTITEAPEQVELCAVARGKGAQSDEGDSPFTRELLKALKNERWPEDLPALYREVRSGLLGATGNEDLAPSLRIRSPHYEDGYEPVRGRDSFEQVFSLLNRCEIPFGEYWPLFAITVGTLCLGVKTAPKASLSEMVKVLVDLQGAAEFGGYSHGLVQFLLRVERHYGRRAAPVQAWLERLAPGSLETLRAELDAEAGRLVLTVQVEQIARGGPDGFPVRVSAVLSDAHFGPVLGRWPEAGATEVPTKTALDERLRTMLEDAQRRKPFEEQQIEVHVLVEAPFFGYSWHTLHLDPLTQASTYSEHMGFVLCWRRRRSRGRQTITRAWQVQSDALRGRGGAAIPLIAPRFGHAGEQGPALSEGLTLFPAAPRVPPPAGDAQVEQALFRELEKGLCLACWPLPEAGGGTGLAERLGEFLAAAAARPVEELAEAFMVARRDYSWARDAVLFLDLAPVAGGRDFMLEEAVQL